MSVPNQKLRRDGFELGVLGMQVAEPPKRPGFKRSPSLNIGVDNNEDTDPTIVFRGHMHIAEGWFNNKTIDEESWMVQFNTVSFNKQNLIHAAITSLQSRKSSEIQAVFPDQALRGISSLVLSKPSLFTQPDTHGSVPMFTSLKLDASLLIRVLGLLLPDSVLDHLDSPAGKSCDANIADCPLSQVDPGRLDQCRKKSKSTTSDSERNGVRALHHGDINVGRLRQEDDKLREILRKALEQGAMENCLGPLLVGKNYDSVAKENGGIMPVESFKTLLKLCPIDVFSCAPPTGLPPLHMAVRLYESPMVAYDDVSAVIQALIERCPSSIFLETVTQQGVMTPYRLLASLKPTESAENMSARNRVREQLKKACICHRVMKSDERNNGDVLDHMWSKKKEFLYWDAKSERHFLLSLMEETVMVDKQYIEILKEQSGMKFETILEFVELPYWKAESPKQTQPQPQPGQKLVKDSSAHPGVMQAARAQPKPDPYPMLFSWLSRCGVTKIFEIKVNDDGPEAHTDAAIREALRGKGTADDPTRNFEVEIWDWKKFDMCAETVTYSAPDAREVHLYSRGNTAVLRGWACDSSFAKLQKLKKLYIDIYPQNPRDDADCEEYKEALIRGIHRQCPWLTIADDIKVNNHGYQAPGSRGIVDGSNKQRNRDSKKVLSEVKPTRVQWLANLQKFTDSLINLDPSLPAEIREQKPAVRIALLDDGCRLEELRGTQEGYSFRSETDTFFVGPCSHGTLMASCIRQVCPIAQLVIIRLDDSRREENQRFTISSCCKALRWALDHDVDVISMSWTFQRKDGEEDHHKREFAELIAKAVRCNKVLFGALSDNPIEPHGVAPASLPGVINIGSATIYGERSRILTHARPAPDFILPGEEIDVSPHQKAKGSSFATAFAAGLAGVVLYCLKLHCAVDPYDQQRAKALRMARTHAGMRTIFNALSGHKNTDDRAGHFVQPYHTFGDEFPASWDERVEYIQRVVNEILPADVVRNFRD